MINPLEDEADVRVLRAIGSPVRWTILNRLAVGPCVVGALVEITGESQSTVSQHLHLLRELGLVQCVRRSVWREYGLAPGVARFLGEVRSLASTLSPPE